MRGANGEEGASDLCDAGVPKIILGRKRKLEVTRGCKLDCQGDKQAGRKVT